MNKHLLLFILTLFSLSFLGINSLHAQCSTLTNSVTQSGTTTTGGTLDFRSGNGNSCNGIPPDYEIYVQIDGGVCMDFSADVRVGSSVVIPAGASYTITAYHPSNTGNPVICDVEFTDAPPCTVTCPGPCVMLDPVACACVAVEEVQCPDSDPNCLLEVTPGGMSVCGICPILAPPPAPNEMLCESDPNCAGETTYALSVCGVCDVAPPADPVDFLCSSAPSCTGAVNTAMSVCGVCPTIAAPLCPPKHPGTCPPCSTQNPFTGVCTPNSTINECIPISCDDGDPCTSGDVFERNCDGSICVPCAGKLIEIVSIEVVNMRDCDDKGNHNPKDDTFKGDIVVTFNYSPVIEDFIITGDAYFSYREAYCIVNENSITIENRTFKANGERITLHGILNDRVSCSYTKNGLGGQALGPCNGNNGGGNGGGNGESKDCVKSGHIYSTGAYIEGITIDRVIKCYDGGTVHKTSDDYLEAKVTVHFGKSLPAKGVLELSGMVSAYVNLYNVGGKSYTFPGRLKLKYKESNSISVVAADYHSTHARICPINTYAYYTDDRVFLCDTPCSSGRLDASDPVSSRVYTNFNAFQQDRQVDLEWLTNQSDKSEEYIIEKSLGADFEVLTEIANTEFTDEDSYFKFFDELPVLGDNHYRLKQVFMDGHIEYSPVRTVNFGVDLDAISFFPNPAESELFIDLDEYAGKTGHMIISNQLGQIIEEIDFTEIPHDLIKVDFANYINGLYFIKVKVDRSKYVAKKVLVSKLY